MEDGRAVVALRVLPLFTDVLNSRGFKSSKRLREQEKDDDVILNLMFSREERTKTPGYVSVIVPQYTEEEFRRHFRLKRSTVEMIKEVLGTDLMKPTTQGRPRTDLETAVLLPIWTLSNQESFRGICDRFNVCEAQAYRLFVRFCDVLTERMGEFIVWPTEEQAQKTLRGFDQLRKDPFPDVFGCVDGTYIPIKGRKSEAGSYITRKKFKALILQGICDADLRFIDIFVGWPGSSHYARVWRNSNICKALNNSKSVPDNCHLLGDAAYPISQILMTPYKDNGYLTAKKKLYNKKLSSSRVVIENCFGLLKSRFRRLKYLDMIRMDRSSKVVSTACVLHNFCIDQADFLPDNECNPDEHLVRGNVCNIQLQRECANAKRDRIADYLFNL